LNDGKQACPGNWTSNDVVTNPVASDGACTCECNVTQDPDCGTGQIFRYLDNYSTATCNTPATTFVGNSGGCTQTSLYLNYAHYEVNAPPASCVGAICDGGAVCVASDGDVDCPAGFPTKTLVGGSATATCGACGATCLATGTCSGTLSFFTDQQCTTGQVDFAADGQCKANVASTTTPYYSYSYAGKLVSSACAGQPPTSTATASLDKPVTVCCK
jgi:hypothetical protein